MAKSKRPIIEIFSNDPADTSSLVLTGAGKSKIVLTGPDGDKVFITGKNFEFEGGFVSAGRITSVAVDNNDGSPYNRFSNFSIDAGTANGETWLEVIDSVLTQVISKNTTIIGSKESDDPLFGYDRNDIIRGRAGDDVIQGQKGNDRMTGGAGSDQFVFFAGSGRDTITDFDADGGPGKQDFIRVDDYPGGAAITQVGKNTLIDLGNGDTLTLLDVKASQIDETDFILF